MRDGRAACRLGQVHAAGVLVRVVVLVGGGSSGGLAEAVSMPLGARCHSKRCQLGWKLSGEGKERQAVFVAQFGWE